MKRMICLISQQLPPNFILLNEEETRPDELHALYTAGNAEMRRRWEALQRVTKRLFPKIHLEEVKLQDAYDMQETERACCDLLEKHPEDEWSLNATCGTKLMSAVAMDVFRQHERPSYYVETSSRKIIRIDPNRTTHKLPFKGKISLKDYFDLYDLVVDCQGNAQNSRQERDLAEHLRDLANKLKQNQVILDFWTNVKVRLQDNPEQLIAEYDAICIRGYQLYVLECKEMKGKSGKERIHKDLHKLYRTRQEYGGPFGKTYWVFDGSGHLTEYARRIIKLYNVSLIEGVAQVATTLERELSK